VNNPFVGFVPWIIFWVVASPSSWEYATLGALLAAVILAIPSAEKRRLKILDVGTILFFAVLSVLAIFLDRADLDWLEDYSQVVSSGALALIAFGSMLAVPFTEQYARETTPREYWNTPTFKQINRVLTMVWGLAFTASAICGLIAEEIESGSGREWLNWIIPIVIIVGAFKFTAWYPAQVKGAGDASAPAPAPPPTPER
jgi:hypothetical protein